MSLRGVEKVAIYWFRYGLRLHDNPALREAVSCGSAFTAIYIFDTAFKGTEQKSIHQYAFIMESLSDLQEQLRLVGAKLHVFRGNPVDVFRHIHSSVNLKHVFCETQPEPVFEDRDLALAEFFNAADISYVERVSHTLWDPRKVIEHNGGVPPLTYDMFTHVALSLGPPERPVKEPEWFGVRFATIPVPENPDVTLFRGIPACDDFPNLPPILIKTANKRQVFGGEREGLKLLAARLKIEQQAFEEGTYRPNQGKPDLLGPPMAVSAALAVGCISVRKFYWAIHDLYNEVYSGHPLAEGNITGQLMWREYFYTMSANNPHYHLIENNPICLKIPWYDEEELLKKWKLGQTGYPFIDASMRQLMEEGWMHHAARNAVALFLTRGDLWVNWEPGHVHFLEYLVDADWAVNAGNWLWVSSSAFERILNCSSCVSPVFYGRRMEPTGEYIRRYVPELKNFSIKYIHEPWKAPLEVQKKAGCVIGVDYPERCVIHETVAPINQQHMVNFRKELLEVVSTTPPHCHPSSDEEIFRFFYFPTKCAEHGHHV